jgi:hypothetical protein
MKKGKTSKLNIFDDAKCHYGTVDSKNLKSIYLVLQTWIEPNDEYENWSKLTGEIKRNILHTLLEVVDCTFFEKKYIVDLDLRTSGIKKNKKSFLNLEVTLFTHKENIDFKSIILRSKIKKILSAIYKDDLKNSKYFTLNITKTKEMVSI